MSEIKKQLDGMAEIFLGVSERLAFNREQKALLEKVLDTYSLLVENKMLLIESMTANVERLAKQKRAERKLESDTFEFYSLRKDLDPEHIFDNLYEQSISDIINGTVEDKNGK